MFNETPIVHLNRKILYKFKNNLERKAFLMSCHKWMTLSVILLCIIMFHEYSTLSYPPARYEVKTFLTQTPKSLILLLGLILSVTSFGSRRRLLTSVLLLPSFGFITLVPLCYSRVVSLLILTTIAWSYWVVIRKERAT